MTRPHGLTLSHRLTSMMTVRKERTNYRLENLRSLLHRTLFHDMTPASAATTTTSTAARNEHQQQHHSMTQQQAIAEAPAAPVTPSSSSFRVPSWLALNDDGGGTGTSHHLISRQEEIEIDGSISPCCWLLSLPVHCGFCPYQTGA